MEFLERVLPQRLRQHVMLLAYFHCRIIWGNNSLYPFPNNLLFNSFPNIFKSHFSNSSSQRIYLNRYVLPMFYKRVYPTASPICFYLLFINQGIPTVGITLPLPIYLNRFTHRYSTTISLSFIQPFYPSTLYLLCVTLSFNQGISTLPMR